MKKVLIIVAVLCALIAVFVMMNPTMRTEVREVMVYRTNEVAVMAVSRTASSNEAAPEKVLVPEEVQTTEEDDGIIKIRVSPKIARTLAPSTTNNNR